MSTTEEKAAFRERIRQERSLLSPHEYALKSLEITDNLRRLPELIAAATVHTFLPSRSLSEPDIMPLIRELQTLNVEIVVPVVTHFTKSPAHGRLRHCRLGPDAALAENRWGVPEPKDHVEADLAKIDVVIVPALACDRRGFRLGFGYGYYDQFLENVTVPTICPCFEPFLFQTLPIEEHDRAVDIIVTETAVLRPGRERKSAVT